ncbi:DNA-directed RNA polymerase sigma-70 factor [Lentibacillus kapialis]|uniref:DNA-directed RNA polymerase sigma-70 factor n=1 Tax=Lentibacillus kapialis TaxID=340214 RepID=A0A917PR66_9BACI|nr:sigma-70 family RNA polymerase sigma factor [Lentibacillus kapialis]GGJ88883.1 DNA-directed RNA polymerase sigma-70 factor [Lentibacillus kapialis]
MKDKSDQELMELIVQEHRPAFEELYDRYIKLIYSYALKAMSGDKEKTKEIVQQVFLRIWVAKQHYDSDKGQLVNWLITVTRNISIDYIRKEKKLAEKQQKAILHDSIEMSGYTLRDADNQLTKMEIEEAKSKLSEEQRRLITLLYWGGYSLLEIAEFENQKIGTIKSRLHQSLKRLRYYLGTEGGMTDDKKM